MVEKVPLYISDHLHGLTKLIQNDNIKGLKRLDRLPSIAHRMFAELLQIQNDQEKCYIIAKRYVNVMDHLFSLTADRRFLEICYGNEYRKVKTLITDLESDLTSRYADLSRRRIFKKVLDKGNKTVRKLPTFDKIYITSEDLYEALSHKWNVLLVDIRHEDEFKESHIIIDEGRLINIPADVVVPGLSANALTKHLRRETRDVWSKRNSFEAVVLLDWNTDHFSFFGSKLERLRSCIVLKFDAYLTPTRCYDTFT